MKRLTILILAVALIAAACASNSGTEASETSVAETTTSAAATTTEIPVTTTEATPTTTTAAGEPATAEDAAAITATYDVVFSSKTTFDEKAPLIDDATGLQETVATYLETGESMGGISLAATAITVDGDTAVVTYDLLFGGTPTYPGLTGDAVRVDSAWIVTRDMFCSIMTSARVGCPTS